MLKGGTAMQISQSPAVQTSSANYGKRNQRGDDFFRQCAKRSPQHHRIIEGLHRMYEQKLPQCCWDNGDVWWLHTTALHKNNISIDELRGHWSHNPAPRGWGFRGWRSIGLVFVWWQVTNCDQQPCDVKKNRSHCSLNELHVVAVRSKGNRVFCRKNYSSWISWTTSDIWTTAQSKRLVESKNRRVKK